MLFGILYNWFNKYTCNNMNYQNYVNHNMGLQYENGYTRLCKNQMKNKNYFLEIEHAEKITEI